jgi:hypothetical protein
LQAFSWYKNYLSGLIGNRDISILLNDNDNHLNKNLKFQNSLQIQEGKISLMSFHFQTPKKPVKISFDSKLALKRLTPTVLNGHFT